MVVHRIETMGDGFSVELDDDGAFRVRGARIERVAAQTNFESRNRRNGSSATSPAGDRGRAAPGRHLAGDTVRIGATELEWEAQPWERT